MKNIRENVLKYGTYFLIFILPLLVFQNRIYPHISSKIFFMYGVVQILLALWIYTVLTDKTYALTKKTWLFFAPFGAFLAWMTISGIFAVSPGLSFWSTFGRGTGLLTWYHIAAFAVIVASLIGKHGKSYWNGMLQWILGGSFILALSLWFGPEGINFQMRSLLTSGGGGYMGNSTLAAAYLLFSLGFGVVLLLQREIGKTKKGLIAFAMAMILFSPVFINVYGLLSGQGALGAARAVVLALIVSLGTALIGWFVFSPKKNVRIWGISVTIVSLIAFVLLWMRLLTPGTELHDMFAKEARGSRFIFWSSAVEAMNERPLLGYGPEHFMVAFQSHFNPAILKSENSIEGWTDRAHNIMYELGSTGGYPAIFFYALFLGSLFYALYVATRAGKLSRIEASVLAGLLVGYVFQNLFAFDSVPSLIALSLFMAGVFSLTGEATKEKGSYIGTGDGKREVLAMTLFILCIVAWVFFVHRPARKAAVYPRVFKAQVSERPEMYKEFLKGPSMGDHWDASGLAHDVYRSYVSNPTATKGNKEVLPLAIKDVDDFLSFLDELSKENDFDYRLYISKVHLHNTLVYLTDASSNAELVSRIEGTLEKAKELAPTHPAVYWNEAQISVWKGDLKAAEDAYRTAISLDPTLPASHRLLIGFAQAIGDEELYKEVLEDAQTHVPDFSMK